MNPTGHADVYFDHICADTPTRLRACHPGEMGAVVSRYHKIAGYDWLAVPILPYLYAVEDVADVPAYATLETEEELRDAYRKRHLRALQPDTADGTVPRGEWIQLVGAAYDRTIHGFTVSTTADQEERFIAEFNDRRNVSHFNLFFNNCSDLSRVILNGFYSHAIHRNFIADFGFTTPKNSARSLVRYDRKHPEMNLQFFLIPQVPGTIERSTAIRGVMESLVKSKRYVVPLTWFQPYLTGGMTVAYLSNGRFAFPKDAAPLTATELQARVADVPSSVLAPTAGSLPAAAVSPASSSPASIGSATSSKISGQAQ